MTDPVTNVTKKLRSITNPVCDVDILTAVTDSIPGYIKFLVASQFKNKVRRTAVPMMHDNFTAIFANFYLNTP